MREYEVIQHGSGRWLRWTVEIDGEVHAAYLSEWTALLHALDAAKEDNEHGLRARVVMRAGSEGPRAVLWKFGDPRP
jgi:hypothetical protein